MLAIVDGGGCSRLLKGGGWGVLAIVDGGGGGCSRLLTGGGGARDC